MILLEVRNVDRSVNASICLTRVSRSNAFVVVLRFGQINWAQLVRVTLPCRQNEESSYLDCRLAGLVRTNFRQLYIRAAVTCQLLWPKGRPRNPALPNCTNTSQIYNNHPTGISLLIIFTTLIISCELFICPYTTKCRSAEIVSYTRVLKCGL